MNDEKNLKLVYVAPIGKNNNDEYEYDFYFSSTPDIVWGQDWNVCCPSACGDIKPEETTYSNIIRVISPIKFFCAQENSCFSMQDCIDGCIAICFQSLDELETYPEPYRIVFSFGEKIENVREKLMSQDIILQNIDN